MVEELREMQEELDYRTQVEKKAVRLISECRFDEAVAILDTLDDAVLGVGQPAVYDVDKVVEQLGELNDNEFCYANVVRIIKSGSIE